MVGTLKDNKAVQPSMNNPEYEKEATSGDETGFSEQELDLDIECGLGSGRTLRK